MTGDIYIKNGGRYSVGKTRVDNGSKKESSPSGDMVGVNGITTEYTLNL